MTDELDPEVLGDFFDYIWGPDKLLDDKPLFVYLPVHHAPFGKQDWQPYFFEWPRQRAGIVRHCLKFSAIGDNVYYSPALYTIPRPKKENVFGSWVLWVDFDGNAPKDWSTLDVPEPTLRVQSSVEGHEHCYWALSEFLTDLSKLEDRNRAIARTLRADSSGWDANQILRPPGTMNHRRGKKEGPEGDFPVTVKSWER